MNTYHFNITISGEGNNADEAYNDAVNALSMEAGETPEEHTIFDEDGNEINEIKE